MRRGRALLVVALVASVVLTGVVQSLTQAQRRKLLHTPAGGGSQSVASMDSFALALLLGGLRGPLVMLLWTQSEDAKSAKKLEGVETQIEWIRLLQPEFDSVHLFQIWNKAYNISAQMASLPNKYSTILDAVEYARNAEADLPGNINLLITVANIFNDKLGNSHEKAYYLQRVRQDSLHRELPAQRIAGVRPTRYRPLLNPDGTLREELIRPTRKDAPQSIPGKVDNFYDGAELQFLRQFRAFPYGVSPRALGYNYYKRAQMLQRTMQQRPSQVSPMALDGRAALAMMAWTDEEWGRGSIAEAGFWGLKAPKDRFDALTATASQKPAYLSDEQFAPRKAAWDEALFQLRFGRRLADGALAEFLDHLSIPDYAPNISIYQVNVDYLKIAAQAMEADESYLLALRAQGQERQQLLTKARDLYGTLARDFGALRLRYFVSSEIFERLWPRMDRAKVTGMDAAQIATMSRQVDQFLQQTGYDPDPDQTREYQAHVEHCRLRQQLCAQALGG